LVREENAFRERQERDGAAGIGELPGARRGKGAGIGAELARRARRAVLWVLQVADEVVMLERGKDQDGRVERDAYPAEQRSIVTCRRNEYPSR
jgi:hypothetical protein